MSFTYIGGLMVGWMEMDEILEFEPSSGTWVLVDRMMSARFLHAVSVISTEEINIYC